MALRVGNRLLPVTSVGQREGEVANVPFTVRLLFQELDVHVWNCHGKSVVKSNTPKGVRQAQCRHSRYILCHSYALGV